MFGSAISALAVYDGAIAKIFKTHAEGIHEMPHEEHNTYNATLFELSDWSPVEVVTPTPTLTHSFNRNVNPLPGSTPNPNPLLRLQWMSDCAPVLMEVDFWELTLHFRCGAVLLLK